MQRKRMSRGFTLVEIMIVLAILVLLLAMVVAVVALKLLPATDLRKLVSSLTGRVRPSSGK